MLPDGILHPEPDIIAVPAHAWHIILGGTDMWLRRFALGLSGTWLAVVFMMMTLETRLVYPARDPNRQDWKPQSLDHRQFECRSRDGTRVHGWVLPGSGPGPAIVVFHGNAEDVAEVAPSIGDRLRKRLNATVLVFDYRGYGQTRGVPNEERVIEDGEAAVRAFAERMGTTPEKLVFYARSLGGGIALGVAERTGSGLLILDRTFNRLTDAAWANYPFVPTPWIMRNRFDSEARIARLDVPLLQSHFTDDEIIPLRLAERLYAASPASAREFVKMEGGGHLVRLPESWWPVAIGFVARHAPVVGAWQE